MNSTRFILSISAAVSLLLAPSFVRAESSVTQAFQVARGAVNQDVQNRVVSIYGTGSPDSIQKWYIIFYDPTIPSHGRAVLVQDGQIVKTYAANGGVVYRSDLTFDPARMTPEGPALAAAQDYASKHNLTFDSVRALLKQTPSRPFRWRIELMSANQSRGYVFINALDSSVASYSPAGGGEDVAITSGPNASYASTTTTTATTTQTQHHGNLQTDSKDLGTDVKRTFLGIGGDLQEFFTGERTVDKDDDGN